MTKVDGAFNLGWRFGISDSDAQILYFAASIIVAVALFAVTFFYAVQNRRMVDEMRRQNRPYVYLACDDRDWLVLRNVGTRSAHDIAVTIVQDIDLTGDVIEQTASGEVSRRCPVKLTSYDVIRDGVRTLVPGGEVRIGYAGGPLEGIGGQRLEAVLVYTDGAGLPYDERLTVDVAGFQGT